MARKRLLIPAILFGLAAVGMLLVFVRVLRPSNHAENEGIAVDWRTAGKPGEVTGVLVDDQGRPAPGVAIQFIGVINGQVADDKYSVEDATTDAEGRFAVRLGQAKINGLKVGDPGIAFWFEWVFGDSPLSCSDGLEFRIRLKPKQ